MTEVREPLFPHTTHPLPGTGGAPARPHRPPAAAGPTMTPTEPTEPSEPSEPSAAGCGERAAVRPATPRSAAAARQYVRNLVRERWRGPSGPADEQAVVDVLLVVSELVSNAVRHGGGLARFEVTLVAEGVRLGVHDHSGTVPPAAFGHGTFPLPDAAGGFGWPLIIRLAREIHVERRPEGGKAISVLVPLA
ncbi:ATP-binding protein [Streptomyces sp. NPDC006458]|uniref:ATP-binding protein n=1 Tax=Streptomyces sp. NPDC006458 TaxID=3154302 RepID=UPI0033BBF7C8